MVSRDLENLQHAVFPAAAESAAEICTKTEFLLFFHYQLLAQAVIAAVDA